jgi:hypothetical protein
MCIAWQRAVNQCEKITGALKCVTEAIRRGTGADGRRSPLPGTCHPLADSSYTDAEGLGKLPLGPTLLFEVPGL